MSEMCQWHNKISSIHEIFQGVLAKEFKKIPSYLKHFILNISVQHLYFCIAKGKGTAVD